MQPLSTQPGLRCPPCILRFARQACGQATQAGNVPTIDLSGLIPDSRHYRRLSARFSREWPEAIAQRREALSTGSGRRRTIVKRG
jgi:hypothetical protein